MAQAVATHDAPTQAVAHQTLGIIATLNGYGFVGRDHLTAAIALLDAGLPMSDLYPVSPDTFHVLGLLEVDAIDEAIAAADKARQRAEQLGALAQLPGSHLAAAAARLCTGRWDDALAEIEAGQAVVDDTGNQFFVLYYDAVVARIAIHRGDLATAHNRLKAGIRRFTDRPSHTFGADWLFGTQAEYLAATGKPEAALAVAETTWTKTAHTRYVYGHRGRGILLVRLAVAAARDDLADNVTVELEEGARRCPTASAIATALQCRGLVQRDPDQLLEAVARYRTDTAASGPRRLLRRRRRTTRRVRATRRSHRRAPRSRNHLHRHQRRRRRHPCRRHPRQIRRTPATTAGQRARPSAGNR